MFKQDSRRAWVAAALLSALAVALLASLAPGASVRGGSIVVDFDLDSAPRALPASANAPIAFWGSTRIRTIDNSTPPPLKRMSFEVDRYGDVETRGLPVCPRRKLEATTVAAARRLCGDAIVGAGTGRGVLEFPEQPPVPVRTPLTFFNAPRIGGDQAIIVHAHLDVPAPTTYLVPLRIERIDKGLFAFRIAAKVPPIAGGAGSVTSFSFKFDRKWRYRGRRLSYIYARCPKSLVLQARIEVEFADETVLDGRFANPCEVR